MAVNGTTRRSDLNGKCCKQVFIDDREWRK